MFYHLLQYNILLRNGFVFCCDIEQYFAMNDKITPVEHTRGNIVS
jgi:hypothetical protein